MKADEILKRIEDHTGHKLDLSNRRDLFRYQMSINREFEKLESKLQNIQNVMNGHQTYDQSTYKVILDSRKKDKVS